MNNIQFNVKKLTIGLISIWKLFTKLHADKKMSILNDIQKKEIITN